MPQIAQHDASAPIRIGDGRLRLMRALLGRPVVERSAASRRTDVVRMPCDPVADMKGAAGR